MNSFDVIKTVRLTEKAARLSTGTHLRSGTPESKETVKEKRRGKPLNQYTFMADRRATKLQIRKAIEDLFKVKVTRVNTLNVRGKHRRQRTHQAGRDPDWKKAIVTLKDGDKIILT